MSKHSTTQGAKSYLIEQGPQISGSMNRQHPENPAATKAYLLIEQGKADEAARILEGAGYKNIPRQIEQIQGFIELQRRNEKKTVRTRTRAKLCSQC